ncbi:MULTISPECIES: site-specific integrase [Roseomonadaceae]|uniref:DUF6538 domain-containing protein n=1 Tax=Falsiroseomonas oleicola TaxID=2801474 RepID=A0ABS6HGT0_9PROT|nr:site-specific integrase [Roseomonas oleicola]MBU8547168.1 hypothetical protein [Roseomonas oleicola]
MVLAMPRPQPHPKSGVFRTRVRVPRDLRQILGRLELVESLGTKDRTEAAKRHPEVLSRFLATLEAARAELGGKARHVTPREVAALAGLAYREAVQDAEARPGTREAREAELDGLLDRLTGPHGDSQEDLRTFVPAPADLDDARVFLRGHGIAADQDSVARMAEALWSSRQQAVHVALRRAAGDWSPDPDAARFPELPSPAPAATEIRSSPAAGRTAVVKTSDLLAAFARENPQVPKTLDKRAAALRGLEKAAGHDDAGRITKADVRAWKEARLAEGKALKTIADGIAMLRPVWAWGVDNGLVSANPFSGMAPKKAKGGPAARVPFDDQDAVVILTAARRAKGFLRWLPWVLALSGCRIEEACGAVREDVREVRGVWVLDVNPEREGRSLKTAQAQRLIPLHPALIAEGFLSHVQALKPGSPLFPDLPQGHYGGRGEVATKRQSRWVRGLGITDPKKAPAHSWRHLMAETLRFLRVPTEAADAILGHDNPTNAGAGYGAGWRNRPDELLVELAKVTLPAGLKT